MAHDTKATIAQAGALHAKADRPNAFIKIPGTIEGLPAIEECTFAAVPNVTLLFSAGQYQAGAQAYLRGIERRVAAGLDPAVTSVASAFVSRWDAAVTGQVPAELRDGLGIAAATLAYRSYRDLLDSPRWGRLANEGARPQRLLWASTSTKNPDASDVMYVTALAAPFTINTMPEKTLHAFADHGQVDTLMPADGGDADQILTAFNRAGIDHDTLAARLQSDGADSFDTSWHSLLASITAITQQARRGRQPERRHMRSQQQPKAPRPTTVRQPAAGGLNGHRLSATGDDTPVMVRAQGISVLLACYHGMIYALGDRCTNRGAPLHQGPVADDCVTCLPVARQPVSASRAAASPAARPAAPTPVRGACQRRPDPGAPRWLGRTAPGGLVS